MRKFLSLAAAIGASAALLTACAGQQPTGNTGANQESAGKAPQVELKDPGTIAEPKTAAQAPVASPAAVREPSPTTAAARQAVTPEGRVVYLWHTALSPQWFDPQENQAVITPYGFQYALHDALVKHLPNGVFSPSLAESYDIAPDFKSATFKLREGIKFHNGEPVTPQDVKFSFENYRGANANILHEKTASVETPDARTVKFNFKEPFLDFLVLYGSPASGAGWVVPAKYYQEVGPDGFKQNPIGAGPYKFVRQTPGSEIELEAFPDYWRKTPAVKNLVIRGVSEGSTRVAALQTGEADFINNVPGELLQVVQNDPKLALAPVKGAPVWLEFPSVGDPNSPFSNPKVRQAISLALDREAISEAETGGLSLLEGNWIPEDWPGAITAPEPQHNLERARQLMAEAGYPDGFDAGQVTPLPPYFSLAERVIGQLGQIGIRATLNQMERGAFLTKLAEGPDAFPPGITMNISGAPGDAASRVRAFAICEGASSRICIQEIDSKFQQYEQSTNPQERERLLNEIQQYMLDNHIFVPVYRAAFINAKGSKVANQWDQIIGAIPQYLYVGPYEDVQLNNQ